MRALRAVLVLCVMITAVPACWSVEAEPQAPEAGSDPPKATEQPVVDVQSDVAVDEVELTAFIRKVDEKADALATLEADFTYTRAEGFSGRKSVHNGKVYVRKPHSMLVDFQKPYPRKVWFSEKDILDYKVDLNTAEKVLLAEDGETPEIIGLTARFGEMRDRFAMTLSKADGGERKFDVLTLAPLPDVEADFTSAEVEIDPSTLLPVRVKLKDAELDEEKTFEFSNIRENPRLSSALFEPKLRRDTDVSEFKLGDWKGL